MALTTFQEVIDRARETHASLPEAKALVYAEEVYRELVAQTEIGRQQVSLSLVAGTRDYALPAGVVNIIRAVYHSEVDNYFEIYPKSEEVIEELRQSYRVGNESGDPQYFALIHVQDTGIKPRIRFEPIPDTTTSSGYPVVKLEVNVIASVFDANTTIPELVPNPDVFVDGILAKYSKILLPKEYEMYRDRYQVSLDRTITFLKDVSKEEPDMIRPSYAFRIPNQS